jgi:pimeloyl-ACP methyl ester carboxylesterase
MSATANQTRTSSRTFVLVHGAWHGGWCWQRVARNLRMRGHEVYAPTLTGLAERSHLLSPSTNLDTHIADIVNLIRWERLQDIVLVGHSYAGMVISGVAEQVAESIGSLVYVEALVPRTGQSASDIIGPAVMATFGENIDAGGYTYPPPSVSLLNVNAADAAWVPDLMTPQPIATMTDRIVLSGAAGRIARKSYIIASQSSPVFLETFEALQGQPAWRLAELEGGHDLMLDAPDALTDMIEHLAWCGFDGHLASKRMV